MATESNFNTRTGNTDRDPTVSIRVWGPRALFTVPHLRADPYSYDVIGPSATKGIYRALYWKPEFEWEPSEIRVRAPIRRDTTKMRSLQTHLDGPRTLQTLTMLVDVEYVLTARIVTNPLRATRDAYSYREEVLRRLREGQRFRQPCFGRSEFHAEVELLEGPLPPSLPITRMLGSMLFDLVPTDLGEVGSDDHPDQFRSVFFRPVLDNGILRIPRSLYDPWREQTMSARDRSCSQRLVNVDQLDTEE